MQLPASEFLHKILSPEIMRKQIVARRLIPLSPISG